MCVSVCCGGGGGFQQGLDVEATFESLKKTFQNKEEITRLESLKWMHQLLERREEAVLKIVGSSGAGVQGIQVALGDLSDTVVISTVGWLGELSKRAGTLTPLVEELLKCLQQQPEYLSRRGPLVIRRLCVEVGALQVFLHLAMSLEVCFFWWWWGGRRGEGGLLAKGGGRRRVS